MAIEMIITEALNPPIYKATTIAPENNRSERERE
jgi:hypothetical protein